MPEANQEPTGARPGGWLSRRWVQGGGAFLIYSAAWVAAMGPRVFSRMSVRILSAAPREASVFVWTFAWWPHALGHASNPLLSSAVWAPTGLNLAWVTAPPGLGVPLAPVTLLAGPVVSFNVVTLLIPGLTAWGAYLLARHVSGSFLAGLAAGALYGFSPVVMREVLQGHLNLSMIFLLPVAGYLVVRRVDGSLGRWAFVALLTAVLAGEFLIFAEIFATMAVAGALVAVTAILLAPKELRDRLVDAVRLVALSFVLATLAVSPYLLTAFGYPKASKPGEFLGLAIGLRHLRDLRRYAAPGPGFLLGPHGGANVADLNFWYLGLPLMAILVVYWIAGRKTFAARLLAAGFFISLVLSWGRNLPLDHTRIPLPWTLFAHLPLLGRARAGRMIAFAWLFAAVSVALWLAGSRGRLRDSVLRWALVVAALLAILPNFRMSSWSTDITPPAFFASQQYRTALCPNEIVMPVAEGAGPVLWQARTDLYFRTAAWYTGFRPDDYVGARIAVRLQRGLLPPDDAALRRFLAEHRVTAIVVGPRLTAVAQELQVLLGVDAQAMGGITLLRLAPCSPSGST